MTLPLQQASAVEPQFAAAVVWPSLAAQTEWVPHADFQPKYTHGYGQNNVTMEKKNTQIIDKDWFQNIKKMS